MYALHKPSALARSAGVAAAAFMSVTPETMKTMKPMPSRKRERRRVANPAAAAPSAPAAQRMRSPASARRLCPKRSHSTPASMPTSMPIRLNIVAIRPDSTSVRPSSSRSPGMAGATLVMYAPAIRPPEKMAQTAGQFVTRR
jgi:hypothetical protein